MLCVKWFPFKLQTYGIDVSPKVGDISLRCIFCGLQKQHLVRQRWLNEATFSSVLSVHNVIKFVGENNRRVCVCVNSSNLPLVKCSGGSISKAVGKLRSFFSRTYCFHLFYLPLIQHFFLTVRAESGDMEK